MNYKTLFFLISIFFIFGCSQSSDSVSQNTEQALPERTPAQAEILNREIIFKNDARLSYCELMNSDMSSYSGLRDTELLPLASTSKLITSAWALQKLGPDYRFQIEIYFNAVGDEGAYDVYLKTNYDPIINIEKLLYVISELQQSGVKKIRHLVIDETTRVYLGVLSNPHIELDQVPTSTTESIENLKLIFNSENWRDNTRVALQNIQNWAQQNNKKFKIPDLISTKEVIYKPSRLINVKDYKNKKIIQSALLLKYLKNMNVFSNNYLADALFSYLGGLDSYQLFQKNILKIVDQELQILTGSGLPVTRNEIRQDNLGTCFSMIKVLVYLRNKAHQHGVNLGQILLNPTTDLDGTYLVNQNYQNSLVLKTGRLFEVPALNAAGFVATQAGVLSFVVLGHDFTKNEANEIEIKRFQLIKDIFDHYPTESKFQSLNYKEIFL